MTLTTTFNRELLATFPTRQQFPSEPSGNLLLTAMSAPAVTVDEVIRQVTKAHADVVRLAIRIGSRNPADEAALTALGYAEGGLNTAHRNLEADREAIARAITLDA